MMGGRRRLLVAVWLLCVVFFAGTGGAFAAPLFPDVVDNHWAHDAVAQLAAKGLLEGYPDGTFKGDRAATRYELAVIVARCLSKLEQEHALFASKDDLEILKALAAHLKDAIDNYGERIAALEDHVAGIERRVTNLERITFEGDFKSSYNSIAIHNTGKGGGTWGADVGNVNGLNFFRGHTFGTIDMLNGRPFINGESLTSRARFGVKIKLNDEFEAGLRLAAYSSVGNPYIDAYWGIPAPYQTNAFAAQAIPSPAGTNNQPWTRMVFDKFILEHLPTRTKFVAGSIEDTTMDNFILQKVPNPNFHGKSMADFTEHVINGKKEEHVVTLRYYEDEETYLPFFGLQASGHTKFLGDMSWEGMYSALPFGANPTAGPGQPPTVNATSPFLYSANMSWRLGDQGSVKVNYLSTRDEPPTSFGTPNIGNYFFWTDPASQAGLPSSAQPMRGNSFISQQTQYIYGGSVNYRFDPTNIRTVFEYAVSQYKPNVESAFNVNGNYWRGGIGWTNNANNLQFDFEYLAVNPYYDPYQLYFNPIGNLALGGVPPGTPLAFAVVPLYYGGFPGSYIPFGYQLHDSGLYPNNRNGFRFSAQYALPKDRGSFEFRAASFIQNQPSTPQRDITGLIHGMPPGFIDAVFNPLMTNGTIIFETPRGRETNLGGTINWLFGRKLKFHTQFDEFKFLRSTNFAPDTITAKKNYVNLTYDVFKAGLDYPLTPRLMLHGGWILVGVKGYHPALNAATYNPFSNTFVGANAGTALADQTQQVPYLGLDFDIAKNVTFKVQAAYPNTRDKTPNQQSFAGTQIQSELNIKY